MPETESASPTAEEQVADLVKRALLQLGEMKEVEEKLKVVSERISKITPPPVPGAKEG